MSKIIGTEAMSMHTNDMAKARRFYTEGLGLEEAFATPDDELVVFDVPNSGPIALHEWSQCQETGGRPPGTVSGIILQCDDVMGVEDRIEAAGGKVTAGPDKGPTGKRFVVVADPDGNEMIVNEVD